MSAATCYLHPRREAPLTCEVCQRAICNRCVDTTAARITCPACVDDARQHHRRGRLRIGLVGLLLVGGIGVGVWVATADETPSAVSEAGSTKRYAEARLEAQRDPEDPHKWLRVAEILIEEGKLAAAEQPLRTALRLAPDDAEINARLGYYEYEKGNEREALARLEHAEALGADDPALGSTIAAIRERLAADEEERVALVEEERAAQVARAQAERARAEALAARAAAATEAAEARAAEEAAAEAEAERRRFEAEACSLPVERRGNHFVVPVRVNGVAAELLYDTGATGLMLSHEIARSAGIALDPGDTLEAQTANGPAYFLRADVETLSVAGGTLHGVRSAVCRAGDPCLGSAVDGLLGVRVIEAMGMSLDAAGSRIRFADCE